MDDDHRVGPHDGEEDRRDPVLDPHGGRERAEGRRVQIGHPVELDDPHARQKQIALVRLAGEADQQRIDLGQAQAEKRLRRLQQQEFACAADAREAVAKASQRWRYHQAQVEIEPIRRYPRRGRPPQGATPDVIEGLLEDTAVYVQKASQVDKKWPVPGV